MADGDRTEIRLAGSGGQGMIMAGAILGEAASLGGLQAACSTTYGSQARGGVTKADVVIVAGGFIDFPHVTSPRILAVMNADSYRAFLPAVAPDGVVLFDPFGIEPDGSDPHPHLEVPATSLAMEKLDRVQAANVLMLGAVVGYTDMIGRTQVRRAVKDAFPAPAFRVNERALDIGLELGRSLRPERGR